MLDMKAWIAALRDPSNKQTTGTLKNCDGAMCCLGLALVLMNEPHQRCGTSYAFGPDVHYVFVMPSADQRERMGLSNQFVNALALCNDNGVTFAQLADFLETGNIEHLGLTGYLRNRLDDNNLIEALETYKPPE